MEFHFAELNIATLLVPLDHHDNNEFVSVLDAVNRIAEVSEGFVWRLKDDAGRSASYVSAYEDPRVIINLTVWESPEALRHFTYRSGHGAYFRRRVEWFESGSEMVCWWIPAGTIPTVEESISRLNHLRTHGPSDNGFLFTDIRDRPS
jgi:heme-degrading monooxygenase HmoA